MSGEISAFGVFMPAALVTGAGAFGASLGLRRVLRAFNAYAFVWHAGLFDVAMFVVLWWLIAYAARWPVT
jgi:protein AaeX